ncbi:MAG: pseudouridine synthase [Rhodobacteraceae bacterium]|nr:pseudouridine synthase [Paracoccaceae bacterium]
MDSYSPPQGPLKVIHLDHELLAIDKPSGLLSVPGKGPELADCLLTRVQADYPSALLVHRLDRDTSGVMLFALSPLAQKHLGQQFERRVTKKVYVAEVWGRLEGKGMIDLPLIVDWPNRPRQMVDHERGKAAITEWRAKKPGDITRVELRPQTGRSHQLRVHMAELGHPILGDPFYATPDALAAADRLKLHAWKLSVRHPDGGEWLELRAKLPF